MAFGGFGMWLGGYFESWILIIDPSVLSPEMPVAVSQWYLDCGNVPQVFFQAVFVILRI